MRDSRTQELKNSRTQESVIKTQYSRTPVLQYSSTPTLHRSIAPVLPRSSKHSVKPGLDDGEVVVQLGRSAEKMNMIKEFVDHTSLPFV
jgi:hypothetical protein